VKALLVARKEVRDTGRSRLLWGTTLLFTAVVVSVVLTNSSGPEAAETAMSTMVGVGTFLLPLAMIVGSYLAITGKQEEGTIRRLLSLPLRRRDVVVGKLLGRSMFAVFSVMIALLVGAVSIRYHAGTIDVALYGQFLLLTVWFAMVWVAVSIGVSAACQSRVRALVGTLGVYLVFVISYILPFFDLQRSVQYLIEDTLSLGAVPALYDGLLVISPGYAYSLVSNVLVRGVEFTGQSFIGQYGGDYPFFLRPEFAFVVLTVWVLAPPMLGYLRFRRMELS